MKMTADELGFVHKFVASQTGQHAGTLLLLHGTGGTENDLLPLGRSLGPDYNLLSPRGKALENGMARYFRRLSEGVFDIEDLKFRTHELAAFAEKASPAYDFDLDKIIAVGFSNGANIGASLLLLCPRLLAGAILLRPMVPLEPEIKPDLNGISVLIMSGRNDAVVPENQAEALAGMLLGAGADVTLNWHDAGHAVTNDEVIQARKWLETIS